MRTFDTGATKDTDDNKLDYEGFLSPLVLERFSEFMHEHCIQADSKLRPSDNWKKGIPFDAYMKSMFRHFMEVWKSHRYPRLQINQQEELCALLFNVQGYLHQLLNDENYLFDRISEKSENTGNLESVTFPGIGDI